MRIFKIKEREGKERTNDQLPCQPTCGPREPHVDSIPLSMCDPRGPHAVDMAWCHLSSLSLSLLSFKYSHSLPFHFKKKKLESRLEKALQFSHLPNTITFTYELGFEWFKLEIVHNRVLYLFQVVWGLFDWLFWGLYTENRTSTLIQASVHIFGIYSFKTFNYLGVSSSIYTCMFGECYWVR